VARRRPRGRRELLHGRRGAHRARVVTTARRPSLDELARLVTRRAESLFAKDLTAHDGAVRTTIAGRRVLAIGGAGSIGSACIAELLRFAPANVTVVDQDENALVELVRDLRSGPRLGGTELRTAPLDFGAPVMRQFLGEVPPFDVVLHFAANKHVRAERDRCSLLQMLDTNLLKTRRLVRWLAARGFVGRLFAVSTDKAANPTNFLGASKRLMERLVFADDTLPSAVVTSARFANVAFSNGSLLFGFLRRLERDQPIAVPRDTRRWFVSPAESGQLCLLAATAVARHHVVVPRLAAERDLLLLTDVADTVLRAHGREPHVHRDEAAARAAVTSDLANARHPVVHTALDTGGEKPFEEFVGAGETTVEIGCERAAALPAPRASAALLHTFLDEVEADLLRDRPRLDKTAIERAVGALLPEFAPTVSDRHLDQRM